MRLQKGELIGVEPLQTPFAYSVHIRVQPEDFLCLRVAYSDLKHKFQQILPALRQLGADRVDQALKMVKRQRRIRKINEAQKALNLDEQFLRQSTHACVGTQKRLESDYRLKPQKCAASYGASTKAKMIESIIRG